MTNEFTIQQGLFKQSFPPIIITTVDERLLERHLLLSFLNTASDEGTIGVSAIFDARCTITAIAFATLSSSLVIHFAKLRNRHALTLVKECILNDSRYTKCAFKMDTLALSLFTDLSLQISDAVDLLSSRITGADRHSLEHLLEIMGGLPKLYKHSVENLFFEDMTEMTSSDVAIQAWAACLVAIMSDITSSPRIDTFRLTRKASCFRASELALIFPMDLAIGCFGQDRTGRRSPGVDKTHFH